MNAAITVPSATTQVYQVFIRAMPEQIWEAITNPDFTEKYFHGARNEYTGGRRISKGPDGQLYADEAVLEFDPPRRLVHGWRSLYRPELAAEPTSRVTWEIAPQDGGYCLLTVVHDKLEGSPRTAENVSGEGWMMVLSGLKTLVETGTPMTGWGRGEGRPSFGSAADAPVRADQQPEGQRDQEHERDVRCHCGHGPVIGRRRSV